MVYFTPGVMILQKSRSEIDAEKLSQLESRVKTQNLSCASLSYLGPYHYDVRSMLL